MKVSRTRILVRGIRKILKMYTIPNIQNFSWGFQVLGGCNN